MTGIYMVAIVSGMVWELRTTSTIGGTRRAHIRMVATWTICGIMTSVREYSPASATSTILFLTVPYACCYCLQKSPLVGSLRLIISPVIAHAPFLRGAVVEACFDARYLDGP